MTNKTKPSTTPEPQSELESELESELAQNSGQLAPKSWHVFLSAVGSFVLLWLSFPPVGWYWLAWIAPVPLVWLVISKSIPGRRPFWQLFFAGLLYWLGTFYFIPIPHPLLWGGWAAVSIYMAIYTPMFIATSRVLVHRFHWPVMLAIPVSFTGIEWIRSNFVTGMAMVCFSHTQYRIPILTQVADLFGAYTLTFAMLTVVAGIGLATQLGNSNLDRKRRIGAVVGSVFIVASLLVYGNYRLNEPVRFKNDSQLVVAMIQSSDDVVFSGLSETETKKRFFAKFELTWEARRKWDDLDLILWPESGFDWQMSPDLLSDIGSDFTVADAAGIRTQHWSNAIGYPKKFLTPVPLLTGGGTSDPKKEQQFGSAFLIANDGQIETRYFKNHLVMFGEYVPFADWFPTIKKLSPIGGGITAGDSFTVVTRNQVNVAPSICFETTIPHFIRRQINTLAESGTEPDVMVNLTNDGWFYGTSCLDFHLACNVFRAIEMRKPHLICANTGLSAEIDSCGRLLQTGPRRKTAVIRAVIRPIDRTSLYRQMGDWIPILFASITLLFGIFGYFTRRS